MAETTLSTADEVTAIDRDECTPVFADDSRPAKVEQPGIDKASMENFYFHSKNGKLCLSF
jgi:hypothetical protein